MKKILATLSLLITIYFPVNAQFAKGDVLLGGSIDFSTQFLKSSDSDQYSSSTGFSILPAAGFFLNRKVAIGASLGFTKGHSENGADPNLYVDDINSYSIGLFARRYYMISEKFFFAIQGDIGFVRSTRKSTYDINTTNLESYGISASCRPLLVFFPSSNWGIEGGIGSIGYNHQQNLTNDGYSNFLNVNAGYLSFGVNYYFRK